MIKKLAASIREYKKQSILAPLTVSLEVVMEVIIPLLMAKLIDKGILKSREGSGEDLVLDLSEEAVRVLVMLDRARVFG